MNKLFAGMFFFHVNIHLYIDIHLWIEYIYHIKIESFY